MTATMEFSEVYAAIKDRITTLWSAQYPAIPVIFTNQQRPTFDQSPTCLHVEIRAGTARPFLWGGRGQNKQRQNGEVIFRIFVPADTDMEGILPYSDFCSQMLRFWGAPPPIKFFDAGPAASGEDDKNGVFFEQDVIASFIFDTNG